MYRTSAEARYQDDPVFHSLVDMIRAVLEQHQFTPLELREAAMLASTMFEYTHIRPLIYLKEKGYIPNDRD